MISKKIHVYTIEHHAASAVLDFFVLIYQDILSIVFSRPLGSKGHKYLLTL
jgi:hypothetical protein